MAWLSLIVALLKAASSITEYLKQKQIIDAATAEALKKNMETSRELISKAQTARKAATDKFDSTGGLLDDKDPNLRD